MKVPRHDRPGPGSQSDRVEPNAAAAEVRRLEPLIRRELEVITDLDRRVTALRRELGNARPDAGDDLPAPRARPDPPVPTGDDTADADALSGAFDVLTEHAEALWFEQQWLTAELSVARGEFDRHGPTSPA